MPTLKSKVKDQSCTRIEIKMLEDYLVEQGVQQEDVAKVIGDAQDGKRTDIAELLKGWMRDFSKP